MTPVPQLVGEGLEQADDGVSGGGELMHRGRADTADRARDDGHRCGGRYIPRVKPSGTMTSAGDRSWIEECPRP